MTVQGIPWGADSWGEGLDDAVQMRNWHSPGNFGPPDSPDHEDLGPAPVTETFWVSTTTTKPCSSTKTLYSTVVVEVTDPPSSATLPVPSSTVDTPAESVAQTVLSTTVIATSSTVIVEATSDTTSAIDPPPASTPASSSAASSTAPPPPPPPPPPSPPPATSTSTVVTSTAAQNTVPSSGSEDNVTPVDSSGVVVEISSEPTPVSSQTSVVSNIVAQSPAATTLAPPPAPSSTETATISSQPPTEESSSSTPTVSTSVAQSPAASSGSAVSSSNTGGVFAPLPTGTSSIAVTTSYSLSVLPTQTASTSVEPTSASIPTSLETAGRTSVIPFNTTSLASPQSSLAPATTTLQPSVVSPTLSQQDNIFVAIATDAPPSNIPSQPNHPVPRLGIENTTAPIETNKFYSNFFLGDQMASTFTHPYSLAWLKGTGVGNSWGIGISHIERSQLAFGPGNPPEYFVNPLGLESVILSAVELGASTTLGTEDPAGFSVNVNLRPSADQDTLIQFPIVQGMAFVTGIYAGGTPLIQSSVFFNTFTYVGAIGYGSNVFKYRITLNDGRNWLMYVAPKGSTGVPAFKLQDSGNLQGPAGFFGTIQIAKNPNGVDGESAFDSSAGVYPVSGSVAASVDGNSGDYTISWGKQGVTQNDLLMFALPHHLASMNQATTGSLVNITLDTTTKGLAQAVLSDSMTMGEKLPVDMDFSPSHPTSGSLSKRAISTTAIQAIANSAASELSQDIYNQSVLDSMYFSGKVSCLPIA